MLRSFDSAVSGLKINQTKLDIVSNNIANANTTGYKSQSVNFEDNISQTIKGATSASRAYGGTNAEQVGMGASVASITTDTTQGSFTSTGRNLDVAIEGGGYFMVASGGNMAKESDCIGVDSTNHTLGDVPTGTTVSYTRDGSFTLDADGNLLTSDGHKVLGYSMMGRNNITATGASGAYYGNFVSISRTQGASTAGINSSASIITSGVTLSSAISTVLSASAATGSSTIKSGDVAFVDANDADLRADGNELHTLKIPDVVYEVTTKNGTDVSIKPVKVTGFSIGTDGVIKATLEDNKVAAVGQIAMASFKNPEGLEKAGGNFYNTSASSGDPMIMSGAASKIQGMTSYNNSIAATDNSNGFGKMQNGYLEASNVDLAQEFTNMIIASRSYQANGKAITTGDEILQDLVGLIR